MWVVKLGGSLARRPAALSAWARALAARPGVVVVPGGGPFADAVRQAQRRLGLSDLAAHAMALHAMAQFAWALADVAPRLRALPLTELRKGPRGHSGRLWLPEDGLWREPGLPASWALSSDSLAAWVAGRLRAEGLLMVKSFPRSLRGLTARRAAAQGRVDPLFPRFLGKDLSLRWAGPHDHRRLERLLAR